jgi:hypothetical protein
LIPGFGEAVGDEWLEKDNCESSSVSFLSASDDVDILPLYLKKTSSSFWLDKFEQL